MAWDLEPKGESLRRAVRWVGERRQENPKASVPAIIAEACLRFMQLERAQTPIRVRARHASS